MSDRVIAVAVLLIACFPYCCLLLHQHIGRKVRCIMIERDCSRSNSFLMAKPAYEHSLKYAMTGAFPPGNKSGQAFVHDPRSIGSQLVKAQVKLRFTSRGGNQMVVVRSK